MQIVMSDAEIGEALIGAMSDEVPDYDGSYHTGPHARRFEIEDGVIILGTGGDGFYAVPLTIDQLRDAFNISRPLP